MFRCRVPNCKGVGSYNLQQISQEDNVSFFCSQCNKEWRAEVSKEKKSCCGRVVVKFTSVEKSITAKPIVVYHSVRKD